MLIEERVKQSAVIIESITDAKGPMKKKFDMNIKKQGAVRPNSAA